MSRTTVLIVLGAAVVAFSGFLLAIDPSREAEGNPSIIDFELAFSEQRSDEIRAEWGPEGEDAARLSLWLDFAYLLVYGVFLMLAAGATRDFASRRRLRRLTAVAAIAVPAAAAAPILDAIENVWLLIALGGGGGGVAPILGGAFATLKFAALAVAIAYPLAGVAARLRADGAPG